MAIEVFVHKMTEHMDSARIIRWLVKEGDPIKKGQIIIELETEKAIVELEAPGTGVLKGIRQGAGDGADVPVGETIAFIAEPDELIPALSPFADSELNVDISQSIALSIPAVPETESKQIRATPVARRMAKEFGIELNLIKGSGPDGRIREEDVLLFMSTLKTENLSHESDPAQLSHTPIVVDNKSNQITGAIEYLPLTPYQRLTGQRMHESVMQAPQFTLSIDVDMTNILAMRQSIRDEFLATTNENVSLTAVLVKVVADTLKLFPRANSTFDNGQIKHYLEINIGVAVGSDSGLFVPVVKSSDQKTLAQVSHEISVYQSKAQQTRFNPNDLVGGTFTISNLGMYDVDRFNAIINPPQSAILAIGRINKLPVGMPDDSIALRPLMTLVLTVDHRVIDGLEGAKFLGELRKRLEKPYLLLWN